ELARSFQTAGRNLKALRETRLDVFELLESNDSMEARAIRGEVEEGFLEHELAVPLARRLQDCVDRAWAVVKPPKMTPGIEPSPHAETKPEGGTVTRRVLVEKSLKNAGPEEAR